MATLEEALNIARQRLQQGKLAVVEDICQQILAALPQHAEAKQLLGLVAHLRQDFTTAVRLLSDAVQQPNVPGAWFFNLGQAQIGAGTTSEAIRSFRRALELQPDLFPAWITLGAAHAQQRDFISAQDCFQQAVQLNPRDALAQFNLGTACQELQQLPAAEAAFRRAIALQPTYAEAFNNLGLVLSQSEQLEDAIANFREAIRLQPEFAEAHNNLGNAMLDAGEVIAAQVCFQQALTLRPNFLEARNNLGKSWRELQQLEESTRCYEHALSQAPHQVEIHSGLSHTLLLAGDWARGWDQYAWRKRKPDHALRAGKCKSPEWQGEALAGKTVLVYPEQGLGDEIMFAGCLPDLIAQGGECLLACESRLVPLFARSFSQARVFSGKQLRTEEGCSTLPAIDYQIALGDLPGFFRLDFQDFPERNGYLQSDPRLLASWRDRLATDSQTLRIGISWQGGKKLADRLKRSVSLATWQPLFQIPGLRWINLQYGECRDELRAAETEFGIKIEQFSDVNPLAELDSFAALIAALDLVISIDNSTVHLAGALGVPTWVALPFVPDWRWLLHREDSPWYPSVRLFRQPQLGNWKPVFEQIAHALMKLR